MINLNEAYQTLGIQKDCTIEDIKSAYRKMAVKTHPDKGGSQAEFIKVQSSYEILCKFHNSTEKIDNFDVIIPDDLRSIIDEIVKQFNKVEDMCEFDFNTFYNTTSQYIKTCGRNDLKNFPAKFSTDWNQFINKLFGKFNHNIEYLIERYNHWFDESLEPLFDDLYKKDAKSYKNNPKFYLYFILISIPLIYIQHMIVSTSMVSLGISFAITIISFFLAKFIWDEECKRKKNKYKNIQVLNVVPFRISSNFSFQSSESLRQSSKIKNDVAAAGGSAGVLFALASGKNFFGDPLIGGAIGLAVGAVVDRLMNPTDKMRNQLLQEFDNLMEMAYPEILEYTVISHQTLLENMSNAIINNYENRVRNTVSLLSSGKK